MTLTVRGLKELTNQNIYYDVEIYDNRQLVYAEKRVQETQHTLEFEIDACKTYRWSVRPSYHIGNDVKFGEWMRSESDKDAEPDTGDGIFGTNALEAPAYIQDFALLEIKCGHR